jgi:hypothetical protein
MTPQQKALLAELRAADYPATWQLSASAADHRLLAGGGGSRRQRAPKATLRSLAVGVRLIMGRKQATCP